MTCMLIGAILNTILDPIFIFIFDLGVAGAAWATIIGQFFSFIAAALYIRKFKSIRLKREHIRLHMKDCLNTASLGHEQQPESGSHHSGSDRHEQLPYLLWGHDSLRRKIFRWRHAALS